MRNLLSLLSILCLFIIYNCENNSIKKDDLQIYKLVIDSFYVTGNNNLIVLNNHYIEDLILKRQESEKVLLAYMNGIIADSGYKEIINQYIKINTSQDALNLVFKNTQYKFAFISQKEFAYYLRDSLDYQNFYNTFPKSSGFLGFTKIGYDRTRTKAFLYFENYCGGLCAEGTYVFLEKKSEKWFIKNSKSIWQS